MVVSLNTNISALGTQRRLGESTAKLNKSFERLSSGLRINRAGDDAAGLAISEALRTDARVFTQGIRNLCDGVSITNIADSTLSEMSNIVTRIQELAEQSANGTLSNKQRSSIEAEAQALSKEYFRISRVAGFNGLRLFDGSTQELKIQAGYGDSGTVNSSLGGKLGTGTFTAGSTYTLDGNTTIDVAAGDLNGDGLADLVSGGTTDSGQATTYALLNRGDGTFSTAWSANFGTGANRATALGDVNNDGILDLLLSGNYATGGSALVCLGKGDGTFTVGASYVAESVCSYDLALADLNGDQNLDLITAGDSTGTAATIRLGAGNGTFGAATSFASNIFLATGDLNGDGVVDLVAAGTGATVSLGNGDGTFRQLASYTTEATGWSAVALGDLNNDSILDLVTASGTGTDGVATVRIGRGDGTFSSGASYATEDRNSQDVGLADINGDGVLDMVTCGRDDNATYNAFTTIRLGIGDGTFGAAVSYRMFSSANDVNRGNTVNALDVNNDGVTDLVNSGFGVFGGDMVGVMQVFLNDTRGGVSPLQSFSLKTKADALQAIPMLRAALSRISTQRGTIGALQSRLGIATSNLQVAKENYDSARSQITDVNVADESALLLKTQITQQAASAILSQANQAPALALQFLRS